MIKDSLAWSMIIIGLAIIASVVLMEWFSLPVWVDDQYHDLARILLLGFGIASLYYAHSRIDHIESNKRFDEINEKLDRILENRDNVKQQ